MRFSFIHTADIHLGRSFSDIDFELSKAQKEIINSAHEQALKDLVNFAIDKNVDFVLIAGDTFDAVQKDLHSVLLLTNTIKTLEDNDIGVCIVCGNHDPQDSYKGDLAFKNSKLVKIFGVNTESVPTIIQNRNNDNVAVIYPFGFKTKEYPYSPCKALEKANDNSLFNIGLIHCDKSGDLKNIYAPCTEKEMLELNYDYYALGHIHKPDIGEKIVYPGTIQARSKKDTGEHGFCFVQVENNKILENRFVTCDKVRFYNLEFDISNDENIQQTFESISSELYTLAQNTKLTIINLAIKGICRYKKVDIEALKTELSTENIVVNSIDDNSFYETNLDIIKSSGGVLSQIIIAGEDNDEIEGIIKTTDDELSDLLKLVPEFDKTTAKSKALALTENICQEIYGEIENE